MKRTIIGAISIIILTLGLLLYKLNIGSDNSEKDKIVVAQGAKPKSLDPHRFNDFSVLAVTEHIFNTLVSVNDKGEVIPELATWEYISPKEIIFKIKEGIKFHNGEILTVDDVIFSLNRMLKEPGSYPLVKDIQVITRLDDNRIKVTLNEISAPFLSNLSIPLAGILNKKNYEENKNSVGIAPIGTGPYKVKSWGDGEKIVLESHKEYFKGAPKNKGLIFKTIIESSSRLAALETGEIDIVYGLAPIDYQSVIKNKKLQILQLESLSTDYLVINTEKKNLNNVFIRTAIANAINKKDIIEVIYLGKGREAGSVVSPSIFGAFEEGVKDSFNPEKSIKILKEQGIKPGELNFKLWSSENPTRIQIAQIIQANLKDIGINVEIEVIESGTLLLKTSKGDHDLFLTTWITGVTDSDTILTSLFHSNSIGISGNRAFYKNNEIDTLLEKARLTIDKKERKEYYKEIQNIIFTDAPVVPLVHRIDGIAINRRIKGFEYNRASMRKLYENMEKEN